MALPLIIIVPGGFIKPNAYDDVSKELSHLGYTVLVPSLTVYGDLSNEKADSQTWKDLADKGVPDDVKMLHSHMLPAFEKGLEVVLVGHSYGTLPACLACQDQSVAERHARGEKGGVKAYVNLAGFAYPARGKNIMGSDDEMPPMSFHILEEGILHLTDEAKPLFFSDLPPEKQDELWDTTIHKTQSHKSLLDRPQFLASDLKLPKYYLRTAKDVVANPDFQAFFIQTGHFDDEFELQSGHCPMSSMPDKLAAALDEIAKR